MLVAPILAVCVAVGAAVPVDIFMAPKSLNISEVVVNDQRDLAKTMTLISKIDLIASADRALYEAKQNGRNQHRRHTLEQASNLTISSTEPR